MGGLCDGDLLGSVSTAAAAAVDVTISSTDPALTVSEPTANNFNIGFDENLSKIPFLKTEYTAGETISALKAVYVKVSDGQAYVAKSNGTDPEALVVGLALNAATVGTQVDVILMGVLQDASWSWAANELLFLTPTGSITNIPPSLPTDTYHVELAKALTSNKIMVNIESPITL